MDLFFGGEERKIPDVECRAQMEFFVLITLTSLKRALLIERKRWEEDSRGIVDHDTN